MEVTGVRRLTPEMRNQLRKQQTRTVLLEAAAAVFAARGFHAASLEELADRLLLEARHSPKRMDDIALLLSQSPAIGGYLEAILGGATDRERVRLATSLIINDWRTLQNERGRSLDDAPKPPAVRELMDLIERGVISRGTAREVFAAMVETGKSADAIVQERGLAQQSDAALLAVAGRDLFDGEPVVGLASELGIDRARG